MAYKSWDRRWNETISYLNKKFPGLGAHVESVVPKGTRKDISGQLSLGSKAPGSPGKRHALRGLFLCQRVYYSDLWAKKTWDLQTIIADAYSLNPAWKTESLNYWGGKNEQAILQGIAMFVPDPDATRPDLARVARAGPPSGLKEDILPGNLKLSRDDDETKGAAETCYNGVTAWLLRSGLVSMRWIMRDSAPNGEAACNRLFGTGATVWPPDRPFKDSSVLPAVAEGYIVHMWLEEAGVGGWNGHWVISNGDGTVCGVNNGEKNQAKDGETVLKKYTNNATLRGQFEGYGGLLVTEKFNEKTGFLDIVPVDPPKYGRASLVKFDPLELPQRM